MFAHLQTLAAYLPPNLRRAALAAERPALPEGAQSAVFPAAVLFADVSGFTPLTERLAQKGLEGPEELTRLLNGYFTRMIALIEAQGGEVVKFSGDAVTAVFPARAEPLGVAARRAVQAAEAMQVAMTEFASLPTSVGPVALGMKIGLGAGPLLEAWVGGVDDRWEYVIAGDPLRQVAQAEHQAARGEIVLSPEAQAAVVPGPVPPQPLAPDDWSGVRDPARVAAVLRGYVPGIVAAWLQEGLQDWLAVLRAMSVVFIGVTGLDYSQPEAVAQLHAFLRAAQAIAVRRYEGALNKLAVDDKGTVLIGLFGAPPFAHENDPERALRCALDLQARAAELGLQLAVGVTSGHVFAGPVGSAARREYTAMGDTVNLAARLMALAGPGQVLCDFDTYRSARHRLAFEALPPAHVKGKAGLVRLYRPMGDADRSAEDEAERALVGRRAELAQLQAGLEAVLAGRPRVLLIEGEAGIGKSRLVEEALHRIHERGITSLSGAGRSIEQQTPFRAWRDIFSTYFGLDHLDDPAERQRRVDAHVRDVAPDLSERLPLLNDVLTLDFPENLLVASLDTQLRHESLISLLLSLLRAWAAERPLVLVLDDAHWLDSLSWELALHVARTLTVARVPVWLILSLRPLEQGVFRPELAALAELPEAERLTLGALAPDEIVALAAGRLGVPAEALPEAVAELLRTRSDGNPFFAEELIYFLRDHGLLSVEATAAGPVGRVAGDLRAVAQTLPGTLQGLILSRIDRLPPENQLALKVAAVIGRTFLFSLLQDTLTTHLALTTPLLRRYLDDLAHLDLTPLEAPEPELTYVFKHIITQEVAYETLLFSQRRQLHREVALWYERRFGFSPEEPAGAGEALAILPLLVFHWRNAEDHARERVYAAEAGRWSAAQFANAEAIAYLSRAFELTPETELTARYDLLLLREGVNDLRGERAAQADDLARLAAIADGLGDDRRRAEVNLRRANFAEVTSDYPTALTAVRAAVDQAAATGEANREAEAYIAWGKVLWRQGDYAAAHAPLRHGLELAQRLFDRAAEARSLYYLALLHLYQNDHASAEPPCRQAVGLYHDLGHWQGEADALNLLGLMAQELGDASGARDHYERVLPVYQAMGDRRGETMALSNLGTVYCDLGAFAAARDFHERALALRRMIGDRWGEAVSRVNLALTYHNLGENALARAEAEAALERQREIGDRRGQAYSLTYLGHALAGLQAWPAAAAAYDEARQIREALGQSGLSQDDQAGLARVALAQGDRAGARAHADAILAWVAEHGPAGIEYPLQVLYTCYACLTAADGAPVPGGGISEAARAVLSRARTALLEQADAIRDPALRRTFLENVAVHRAIQAAWAEHFASEA